MEEYLSKVAVLWNDIYSFLKLEEISSSIVPLYNQVLDSPESKKVYKYLKNDELISQIALIATVFQTADTLLRRNRKRKVDRPFYVLILTILFMLSGNTIFYILSGKQVGWLASETRLPTIVLSSFISIIGLARLTSYFPLSLIRNALCYLNFFNALVSGYESGLSQFKTIVAAVFLSVVASSSRGILLEIESASWGKPLSLYMSKMALGGTLLYSLLKFIFNYSLMQCYVLTLAYFFWLFLYDTFFGPLDIWYPLEQTIFAVLSSPPPDTSETIETTQKQPVEQTTTPKMLSPNKKTTKK